MEEEAKWSPCVWIARAGLEFGHHPRWAVLHRGNHPAISLTFSSPYPFSRKSPRVAIKMLPRRSNRPPLTVHMPRRFFGGGLEGGVYQICLRRHELKGVSAGAAGNQLLPKPALEAQGRASQLSFLAHRPCILCKRPYLHPLPSLLRNASPSYLTILKYLSTHTLDLSLRIGEAEPFFRNTLLRWLMAGDRRKPSFPVPDWGTCHKRAGWCPHKYVMDRIQV